MAIRVHGEGLGNALANQLKQIPEITEVVNAEGLESLVPVMGRQSQGVGNWDDKPADAERIDIESVFVSSEYCFFYDFRLLSGEMLDDTDSQTEVLLNENAVKAFGWHDPVGKRFSGYRVKGVISNIYNFGPTIPAKSVLYSNHPHKDHSYATVLFKYQKGMWKTCKEKIERLIEANFASATMYHSEEIYDSYLKSENALIKLLSFVSAICVLICIFGFVSLVSLTCEERRKEIAIRKINGATVGDIISMFAKEYSLLLLIGATIAFTAGYFIMQRWLEHYVKQTSIPAWIYLAIVAVMALVIVLCVGWQVYKTSVENPADVVKSE